MLPAQRYANRTNSYQIPAPIAGIKATTSLAGMPGNACVYAFNILPDSDGCVVRDGYREWANGWTGDPARTVIPFEGNDSSEDKLFVANNEGIWDVTTDGETTPTQEVTFGTQTGDAGICSYVQFTNDGDDRFLLVCDEVNGYYFWAQTTGTWTKATTSHITGGADPANFAFVMSWKERIWFIERGTAKAYYLSTNAYQGAATAFNFGSQFPTGGFLKTLQNWTLDGGAGIDDYLVAVSSSGDVAIYQGTDPAEASTFARVGVWQIGNTPSGRRITKPFGGELYILSVRGAVRASQLLRGNVDNPESYLTKDVAPYLNTCMIQVFDDFGWHLHAHPKTARLYVNAPKILNGQQWGFSYYFGTGAWGMVRDLPKGHTENWQDNVYWVDNELNKIYMETGDVDAVYIDPDTDGDPEAIQYDILTAFSTLELPGVNKRIQIIRPIYLSTLAVSYVARARYDFDISEVLITPDVLIDDSVGIWDTGAWDVAIWGGDASNKKGQTGGGGGIGRTVAVALRGASRSKETLVAIDMVFDFAKNAR